MPTGGEKKLKGKLALVTGAARGIGRSHALRLARLGADIVINDIDLESYKEFGERLSAPTVMDEVRALGVRCSGIEADVGSRDQIEAMFKNVLDEYGHIDILINNAGGLAGEVSRSSASSVSEKDLRATIDRNLMGTIFCCQEAAEPMKRQGWGRIVNTASQAALQAQQEGVYASYGVAKAGVIAYTRYLAQELSPYGVTVNCVAPAYVSTQRLEQKVFSLPGWREKILAQIPLGRMGEPDDISKVVEFFVTDLGDYITGQCVSVCGGAIKF
ncbi:MAG: SDR family oxidoreductase [Deltaproteobacteria bacterium]|nr:SDR family oxidoreductase [Deltaproteobacteria bacterium]